MLGHPVSPRGLQSGCGTLLPHLMSGKGDKTPFSGRSPFFVQGRLGRQSGSAAGFPGRGFTGQTSPPPPGQLPALGPGDYSFQKPLWWGRPPKRWESALNCHVLCKLQKPILLGHWVSSGHVLRDQCVPYHFTYTWNLEDTSCKINKY